MTTPLTPAEAKAEFTYRLHERLGMMTDGRKPTEQEFLAAQAETMEQMREVRKHYENQTGN